MKNSADNPALRERFDRAIELIRQGRTAQSLRILESLRKRYPDHPAILGYLGGIYLDQNRLSQAASALKRATELAPRSELASVGLFHTR